MVPAGGALILWVPLANTLSSVGLHWPFATLGSLAIAGVIVSAATGSLE